MGEWLNARHSYNLFHKAGQGDEAAVIPYAIACGNHDYHHGDPGDLDSREYERFFGPGAGATMTERSGRRGGPGTRPTIAAGTTRSMAGSSARAPAVGQLP